MRLQRFYHGTTYAAAAAIIKHGFKLDIPHLHDVGDFGLGIYLTQSMARARCYGPDVVLVEVDVAKFAHIPNPYFLSGVKLGHDMIPALDVVGSHHIQPQTVPERLFHEAAYDNGELRTVLYSNTSGLSPSLRAAARETAAASIRRVLMDAGYRGITTELPDREAVVFDVDGINIMRIVEVM